MILVYLNQLFYGLFNRCAWKLPNFSQLRPEKSTYERQFPNHTEMG